MGCGNSKEHNNNYNNNNNSNQLNVLDANNNNPYDNNNNSNDNNSGMSNSSSQKRSNVYKILMIGDASVGKTSISSRWVDETFGNNYIATIGVDFKVKNVNGDRIQVWDTAGQERYSTITSTYYRGCHGIIVVYDITSRASFDNVKKWLEDIKSYAPDEDQLSLIILGNKSDMEEVRQVQSDDVKTLGEYETMEVSALNGENIEAAFNMIVQSMKQKRSAH